MIPAPATWRDGVHLHGTSIWCDAPRRRELCFVSSVPEVGHARHGQLLATAPTLALLGALRRQRTSHPETELAVPLGRPFSLGELRLELFASGHGLGAASLRVELPDRQVCFAGVICPAGTPLSGPGDVRRCDALIVDARYAKPDVRFPPFIAAAAEIAERANRVSARGGACVLLVDSELEALDVGDAVSGLLQRRLLAHRRLADFARAARSLGNRGPIFSTAGAERRPGAIVLWPADAKLDRSRLPRGSDVLVCSARGLFERAGADADHAIPISTHADGPTLLDYIEQSGARIVMLARGRDAMAKALRARGLDTELIGPPEQLALRL